MAVLTGVFLQNETFCIIVCVANTLQSNMSDLVDSNQLESQFVSGESIKTLVRLACISMKCGIAIQTTYPRSFLVLNLTCTVY